MTMTEYPDISGSDIVLPFSDWGGSCPVQYEIDYEARRYYVRFRCGWLSVTLVPDEKDLVGQAISHDLDGFWSDEATNVYLALITRAIRDGTLAQLNLPTKRAIRQHPFYRKGPYRGYDPHNSDG
jgi:hypothetical protein